MKKLICCLLCAVVFAGCGAKSSIAVSQAEMGKPSETSELQSLEPKQEIVPDTRKEIGLPTLGISQQEYLTMIDAALQSSGVQELSKYLSETKPDVDYKMTNTTYKVASGMTITIFVDDTNNEISEIFFSSYLGGNDPEAAKTMGAITAITISAFEPDKIDQLTDALHLLNIKEGEAYDADGDKCSFTSRLKNSTHTLGIFAVI